MLIKFKPAGAAVMFLALLWSTGSAQESHVGKLSGNAKRGKALYQRYCIFCHGTDGDGRGESAPFLDPKPRDFTKAVYKCRSTPSGSLPSTAISMTRSAAEFTPVACLPGVPFFARSASIWLPI